MEHAGWSPPDGSYSCELPKTWDFEDLSGTDTPGFVLLKRVMAPGAVPERLAEPASMIRATHYRAGNPFYRGPEEFARRVAREYKPKPTRVGDLPAQLVETASFDVFPPNSTHPMRYETKSRYVVIPQGKGFWSLEFTAISERYLQYLPEFERLADSFRPAGN